MENIKPELSIPLMKSGLLQRPRLIRKLLNAAKHKLTIVSSPSGFGKTTAVRQWSAQCMEPVGWHTIDDDDNLPGAFIKDSINALETAHESLRDVLYDVMSTGRDATDKDILVSLINAVNNAENNIYLVIDDFHLIHSPQVIDNLFFILKYVQSRFHVILLTRHMPPFPLSRFRASAELSEININDLRFSYDETAGFFDQVLKITLNIEQIHDIYARTEGWIAGIYLAGMSILNERGNMSGDISLPPSIFPIGHNDLMQSLFDKMPAHIQTFLMKTSVLINLNADLCNAITGIENVADVIGFLHSFNMFIYPLDVEGKWHRYHRLFAEFLHTRLAKIPSIDIAALHRSAGFWYVANGYPDDAFHHCFATKDHAFAADFLEDHLFQRIANYELESAARYIGKLPENIVEKRYILILFNAWIAYLSDDISKACSIVETLEKNFIFTCQDYFIIKKRNARDLLLALKIGIKFNKEFTGALIGEIKQAVASISIDSVAARGFLHSVLAKAYIESGDLRLAEEPLEHDFEILSQSEYTYLTLYMYALKADVKRLQGKIKDSEEILLEAVSYTEKKGVKSGRALSDFYIRLAELYHIQNDSDKANSYAEKCIKEAGKARKIGALIQGYEFMSLMEAYKGNAEAAKNFMEKAMTIAIGSKKSMHNTLCQTAVLQLAVVQSDEAAVAKWAERRRLSVDEPYSIRYEDVCILLARHYLHGGRFGEAYGLANKLRPRALKRNRFLTVLKVDIIRSIALINMGDKINSLMILEKTVESAAFQNIILPIAIYEMKIVEILIYLKNNSNVTVRLFAHELLKASFGLWNRPMPKEKLKVNNVEYLTQREAQILKMISFELTNKDITDITGVTLGTVKTHIKKIFDKLGISTRKQAIKRARDMKL